MADDTQVAAHVINEQLQFAFHNVGFSYTENLHINETSYTATGPSHFAEQGTFTETYYGGTFSGKFTLTENDNHITSIADFNSVDPNNNTYQYHSSYTANGSGYNIVEQASENGASLGVFHYNSEGGQG